MQEPKYMQPSLIPALNTYERDTYMYIDENSLTMKAFELPSMATVTGPTFATALSSAVSLPDGI